MSEKCVINVDLADLGGQNDRKDFIRTLGWGDCVTVTKKTSTSIQVETVAFDEQSDGSILPVKKSAFITPSRASGIAAADVIRPCSDNVVLKVNFVDVQQGDGSVIESPDGKVILVDGGDNQLFARYLAGRFRGTTLANPKEIECIVVTHGDSDHFAGLVEVYKSERNAEPRKRLFIDPKRYYHNGIVKRAGSRQGKKVPDAELLGPTKKVGDETYLTGLEQSLLDVPDAEMDAEFKRWKDALAEYNQRRVNKGAAPIECRRLELHDEEAFAFFNQGKLRIEVLGPIAKQIDRKPALKFLGNPPAGPRIGHESLDLGVKDFKGLSASHTINGHSIVFRLVYGGFSYLFTGDLNDEAARFLTQQHNDGQLNLKSEVFKVPHHGSADFAGAMVQAVSPIISVVSSGDESARKEFIHPRAMLMGALGKYSRVPEPLVFVTELVAFFNVEGWSQLFDAQQAAKRGKFFGFSRSAYGMVKTRTDGNRLLVYTDSGNVKMKEAYAYELDASGVPQPAPVRRA